MCGRLPFLSQLVPSLASRVAPVCLSSPSASAAPGEREAPPLRRDSLALHSYTHIRTQRDKNVEKSKSAEENARQRLVLQLEE